MAIVSISRIQHRRGLQQDLPSLASAELGWSVDEQRLFIGNGTLPEGAPQLGNTEILTEHSDILRLAQTYTFRNEDAGYIPTTGGRTVRINSVTYGNSLYVAVGTSGTILTSTDSINWTPIYGGVTANLNHVCYGNGKFVAVGASGIIIYSTDGLVWNKATSSVSLTLTSVVWASGAINNFVATSTNGTIILSTDAIDWPVSGIINTSDVDGINNIDYHSGLLVAVGNNASVLYSTDANNWYNASLPPIGSSNTLHVGTSGYNFKAVRYVDDRWIASGDYSTVIISIDGINWVYGYTDTFRAAVLGSPEFIIEGVPTVVPTWVFVGDGGVIYTATDTDLTQSTSVSTLNLYDVTWSDDDMQFVAVGANGTIITSADGATWDIQNSTVTESLNKIIYDANAGVYITVGTNGTVLTSITSGVDWAVQNSNTSEDLNAIAQLSTTTYIAVGTNGKIITSANYTTWTNQISNTSEDLESIVVADLGSGSYQAVATGRIGTIIISNGNDITSWTVKTSGTTNDLHGVNYTTYTYNLVTQSIYTAVGNNGTILTSTDAATWTPQTDINATNHLFNVYYGSGKFWVVGSVGYGTIFGADIQNANTMTIQSLSVVFTSNTGYNGPSLNGIAYGNAYYVIVGQYDTTLSSQDGQNFVSKTDRTFTVTNLSSADIYSVIYENDMFTAVGNKGLILTSANSISWSGFSYTFGNSQTVRTIQAKLDDIVSVKDFGAKGDGLTDDTEAINRALYEIYCKTLVPAARKRLYFPAGRYIVSDGIRVPSNAILFGEGAGNTIIQQTADPSFIEYVMITADSQQQIDAQIGYNGATLPRDIVIQDMTLQNNYDGIHINQASRVSLLRVNILGGQYLPESGGREWSGIYLLGSFNPPADIDISHCEIQGFNYGVYQPDTENSRNIVFYSSTFKNMYKGLYLCHDNGNGGGVVNTMTVSNCIFDLVYSRAIDADYVINLTSTFNSYRDVGNLYQGAGAPDDYNIYFGANSIGCSSITDQFDRTQADNYNVKQWIFGNSHTTALIAGHELRIGLYEQAGGESYELTFAQTNQPTGFTMNFADDAFNKRIKYVITRNNRTRAGVLTATYDVTTNAYNLDDDSSQTGDVGVVFRLADIDDNILDLQYTSDSSELAVFNITIAEEYVKTVW